MASVFYRSLGTVHMVIGAYAAFQGEWKIAGCCGLLMIGSYLAQIADSLIKIIESRESNVEE